MFPVTREVKEYFYYRGQKCRHCDLVVPVFGLGHHRPKEEGEDTFTKCIINFYNYGNQQEKNYLLRRCINLFKERFEGDMQFDLLCVVPTRKKDEINEHMRSFAKDFSEAIDVPHEQVVCRSRTIKGQHEIKKKDERLENVSKSIEVTGAVGDKNILVLDNLSISGANACEVFDALKNAGAKNVYFICFGLGSKGRECDFQINPKFKGKAAEIVANWH